MTMPWGWGRARQRDVGRVALTWFPDRIGMAFQPSARGRPITAAERTLPAAEDVAKVLPDLLRELGAAGAHCTWLLEPSAYQLLQTERPTVPEAEWPAALRWKLRDMIDYPVDDAVIDAFEVPGLESRGRPPSLYVAAARQSALADRLPVLRGAGLAMHTIGVPELAWLRLAARLQPGEDSLAVMALEPSGGTLLVVRGDTLFVPRRFELDTADLLGLRDPNSPRRERVYERIALDMQRTLDYFDRTFQRAPVRRVMLFAGVAGTEGLPALLRDQLGLEVVQPDLVEAFPALAGQAPDAACRLAPLLAVVSESMA